jgi:hypothetical protein
MPANTQTTGTLADALPSLIQSARLFEEYEMVAAKTVDRNDLPRGQGNTWNEIRLSQITAQNITENTVMENFSLYNHTLFSVTPGMVQVATRMTDKTFRRVSGNVAAMLGKGAQLAMNRKLDTDILAQYANFSVALAGTATTLNHGHLSAGAARIVSNTTESGAGQGPVHAVLHGYGLKDLQDELEAGIGTYIVTPGQTDDFYRKGFAGFSQVAGANIWRDDNITIDATPDARGAIYAQNALVLVRELEMRTASRRREDVGGGADEVYMTSGYGLGERRDVWGYGLLHDATVPTS